MVQARPHTAGAAGHGGGPLHVADAGSEQRLREAAVEVKAILSHATRRNTQHEQGSEAQGEGGRTLLARLGVADGRSRLPLAAARSASVEPRGCGRGAGASSLAWRRRASHAYLSAAVSARSTSEWWFFTHGRLGSCTHAPACQAFRLCGYSAGVSARSTQSVVGSHARPAEVLHACACLSGVSAVQVLLRASSRAAPSQWWVLMHGRLGTGMLSSGGFMGAHCAEEASCLRHRWPSQMGLDMTRDAVIVQHRRRSPCTLQAARLVREAYEEGHRARAAVQVVLGPRGRAGQPVHLHVYCLVSDSTAWMHMPRKTTSVHQENTPRLWTQHSSLPAASGCVTVTGRVARVPL